MDHKPSRVLEVVVDDDLPEGDLDLGIIEALVDLRAQVVQHVIEVFRLTVSVEIKDERMIAEVCEVDNRSWLCEDLRGVIEGDLEGISNILEIRPVGDGEADGAAASALPCQVDHGI